MQLVKYTKFEASVLALLLMLTTGITIILSYQAYAFYYGLILICYTAMMYVFSLKIPTVWTPVILYTLCLLPISTILTCDPSLDFYITANGYYGILQATLALSISLLLHYIIIYRPGYTQAFLLIMLVGIAFARNYTSLYCGFFLLYLLSPLNFRLRRFISKYLTVLRWLTLPFILVGLPLILYINPIASCPIVAILCLTYCRLKETNSYAKTFKTTQEL